MGGIEMPILAEREELPGDAIDMASSLLAIHQIEPTHDHAVEATGIVVRSIVQILGGTFPPKLNDVVHWGESTGPDFEVLRAVFADVDRGADLVDFELLKVQSILSSPMSPILGINP